MDGLSLTIGGAALTTIGGIIGSVLKAWSTKRHAEETKIPQPCMTEQSAYQAWCKDNARDHEDIFKRLRNNESAIATLMERSIAQGKILDRMADQVSSLYDRIICGGGKRK